MRGFFQDPRGSFDLAGWAVESGLVMVAGGCLMGRNQMIARRVVARGSFSGYRQFHTSMALSISAKRIRRAMARVQTS